MTLNDMSKTLADKVAVHLDLPFELETDLQLHSITAQMMVQIVDMTDNAIMQEIINYAKENKICDIYLLDKSFVKNALEKQIPVKVKVKIAKDEENRKYHYCPRCNRWLTLMTTCCPDCGQAFDWREVRVNG